MKSKSLPPELQLKRAGRTTLVAIILSVLLLAAVLFSAGIGQLQIPASEVAGSLLHRVGIDWLPLPSHPTGDQTLWSLRFPRVVMAALVGAATQ